MMQVLISAIEAYSPKIKPIHKNRGQVDEINSPDGCILLSGQRINKNFSYLKSWVQ